MALSRRTGQRFQASIWPGFVDAMTGLLLVLMFVLTIFMVVQFVLRETIHGQKSELDALSGEVARLAQALGLEQRKSQGLTARVGELSATIDLARGEAERQAALIASLTSERDSTAAALSEAQGRITSFEEQVAGLLAAQARDREEIAGLEAREKNLVSREEALNLALARAREEIDAGAEAARLAAAKREALEALLADIKSEKSDLETRLSEQEAGRLAEAAAAEALRKKLENADAELTAMTLALEEQRKKAEDTLTLLAAADAAKSDLDLRLAAALLDLQNARDEADVNAGVATERDGLKKQLSAALAELETAQSELGEKGVLREKLAAALAAKLAAEDKAGKALSAAEERAALLSAAKAELASQKDTSAAAQREQALLNQQVAALRAQLGQLQGLLDDYKERDATAQVQLQSLGSDLNAALARAAAEERRRRELEEAEAARLAEEKARLEAENRDLEKYRSEFFGRLRDVLGNREGVRIVGDRFVFSSEVLFPPGQAALSPEGQAQIARVAGLLQEVARDIPAGIDWVIQVDGHTDNVPLSGLGEFADNWELSQARALSVVRYMVNLLGFAPERLSANGFGEYQPVAQGDSEEARAQNRRIELKLTER